MSPIPLRTATARVHILDPDCVGQHLDRLYIIARGLCNSAHEAEDLVQDTLEIVLRRPRVVRGSDLAYLTRAMHNTAVSNHRRRTARPTTVAMPESLDSFDAAVAPSVEGAVVAREVLSAVAGLPAPLRDALVAVHVAGLNCKEAAARLGVREGTIMSRCFRARAKLAPLLEAA
jgi:RNA polymerase sigma-70 factor, ECF subfamily